MTIARLRKLTQRLLAQPVKVVAYTSISHRELRADDGTPATEDQLKPGFKLVFNS
jgi:hypothetical protein